MYINSIPYLKFHAEWKPINGVYRLVCWIEHVNVK